MLSGVSLSVPGAELADLLLAAAAANEAEAAAKHEPKYLDVAAQLRRHAEYFDAGELYAISIAKVVSPLRR